MDSVAHGEPRALIGTGLHRRFGSVRRGLLPRSTATGGRQTPSHASRRCSSWSRHHAAGLEPSRKTLAMQAKCRMKRRHPSADQVLVCNEPAGPPRLRPHRIRVGQASARSRARPRSRSDPIARARARIRGPRSRRARPSGSSAPGRMLVRRRRYPAASPSRGDRASSRRPRSPGRGVPRMPKADCVDEPRPLPPTVPMPRSPAAAQRLAAPRRLTRSGCVEQRRGDRAPRIAGIPRQAAVELSTATRLPAAVDAVRRHGLGLPRRRPLRPVASRRLPASSVGSSRAETTWSGRLEPGWRRGSPASRPGARAGTRSRSDGPGRAARRRS